MEHIVKLALSDGLDLLNIMILPPITLECSGSYHHIIHQLLSFVIKLGLLHLEIFSFLGSKVLAYHDQNPCHESYQGVLPTRGDPNYSVGENVSKGGCNYLGSDSKWALHSLDVSRYDGYQLT